MRFRYISVIVLLLTVSCEKFVAVEVPDNQIISKDVFTDDVKATSAVTAMYGKMINDGAQNFSNMLVTITAGYSSDELSRFNPTTTLDEFINNEITPLNSNVRGLWTSFYEFIYYANVIKEGLEASNTLTPAVKEQLIAECKFVRSFCYFYLINLFGDVPYTTSTNYQVNAILRRTAVSEIYAHILTDLLEAKDVLSAVTPAERVRPNKWVVSALLSRVYLYTEQWAKAEEIATTIIASGNFTPLTTPSTTNLIFNKGSKESIWQLMPNTGILKETREMFPAGGVKTFIRPQLLAVFPASDKRRIWIDISGTYYYPRKYRNTVSAVNEYYMVFRAGEQYLIRAEARLKQNNLQGAIDDINVIRNRAQVTPLANNITVQQLEVALANERFVELFAEWGHRWFDLKRTKTATAVLGSFKPNWKETDMLFPIPLTEIQANPNLTQNPGY